MMDWVIIIQDDGRKPPMTAIFLATRGQKFGQHGQKKKKNLPYSHKDNVLYKFHELWVKILGDIVPKSVRDR